MRKLKFLIAEDGRKNEKGKAEFDLIEQSFQWGWS